MSNRMPIEDSRDGLGVYVHVPFCRSKCRYCDFSSHVPAAGEMDRYANALATEIELRAIPRPVATVYFGGGTPSFFGADRLCAALARIGDAFSLSPDCEITIEANPSDVTAEWLAAIRAAGVNRLSLGIQSLRDEELRFLGRRHGVAEAVGAVRRAREAGFDNLSVDLIAGLPGDTAESVANSLKDAVAKLAPEHVSCYQLTVAGGTPLAEAVKRGEVRMPDADAQADILIAVHETLGRLGYAGYEVSNFARAAEYRSRHNSATWRGEDYIGLGPAAHSFLNPVRSWNTSNTDDYCAALEQGTLPVGGEERLTSTQHAWEIILLGLRTTDGVSLEKLLALGFDLPAEKEAELCQAFSSGLIRRSTDRVVPTLRGMALADRLALELAPDIGGPPLEPDPE